MLPDSVVMNGVTYTPYMSSGGKNKTYMNVDSVINISLREDSSQRLEENLSCLIGLITVSSGWCSFENKNVRKQFLKVVNAYYDRYPQELPE